MGCSYTYAKCIHMHINKHVYTNTLHTHARVYTQEISLLLCTQTAMHVYMQVYTYSHTHGCTYMHVHMHIDTVHGVGV